jgi:hypothetical protein
VKCREAELVEEAQLNARHVAVRKQGLWMRPNEIEIKDAEEVVGTIAASYSGNEAGVWICESRMQIGEPLPW